MVVDAGGGAVVVGGVDCGVEVVDVVVGGGGVDVVGVVGVGEAGAEVLGAAADVSTGNEDAMC